MDRDLGERRDEELAEEGADLGAGSVTEGREANSGFKGRRVGV